jgi:ABC-type uncharacterized transport system permease subunit
MTTESFLWLLFYLVPALYVAAFAIYILVFLRDHATPKRLARPVLVVAVLANLIYITTFTTHFGHIPMVTVHQVLGNVGFAVAATYLWVQSRTQTPYSGPFVLSLVVLCQLVSLVNPRLDHEVPEVLNSLMFSVHVSNAVLGYSALALAGIYGLVYLLLYKEMRIKRFGLFFHRLPPLAVLDQMNFYAAAVGFVFLTVAIATGITWAVHVYRDQILDPKLVVGVITWLFYGATVFGRRYRSWRVPRFAYSSSIGFVALLLSMFAVNFFFTKFHVFS